MTDEGTLERGDSAAPRTAAEGTRKVQGTGIASPEPAADDRCDNDIAQLAAAGSESLYIGSRLKGEAQ